MLGRNPKRASAGTPAGDRLVFHIDMDAFFASVEIMCRPKLRGKPGGFKREDIIIGYSAGKPCPKCRTKIVKIRTGSNATFICLKCQALRKRRR